VRKEKEPPQLREEKNLDDLRFSRARVESGPGLLLLEPISLEIKKAEK
jgi:hypothetical protein